jgi:aspartyl-tRNA(Asn)/glutamyl-tRNA(Gln) amidotransferase subunit C
MVSREDVKKVAHLARIKINDCKIDEIRDNLDLIIRFVEQLNEVNCAHVDETILYASSLQERDDVVESTDVALVIGNAPVTECNMFVVPRVVG